ncbi:hypothetical protein JCM8202_003038 [Rhodotorula sphaerocarpa]
MRRRPSAFSAISTLSFLAFRPLLARTTFYDVDNTLLTYDPAEAWQLDDADAPAVFTNGSEKTMLAFAFAGEQISIYGISAATFAVAIDGQKTPSLEPAPASNLTQSTRIYLASGLDRTSNHSFQLVLQEGAGPLVIDRIGLNHSTLSSTDTDYIPALLPFSAASSAASSLSTAPSSSTTSPSTSHMSTASSRTAGSTTALPSARQAETEHAGPDSGAIAGGVIGALAGLALLLFLAALFARRRKRRRAEQEAQHFGGIRPSPRSRQSVASSFFGALGRPGPSLHDSHAGPIGGAHLSHPYSSPTTQTWVSRLARASSWKRKAERLPETRRFYGVDAQEAAMAAAGVPKQPPPCVPLPSVPPGATREMEERWRTVGPTLSLPARSREPTDHTTVQVYGQALSDYSSQGDGDLPADATDTFVIVPPRPSMISSLQCEGPPQTAQSFRNPFGSESERVSGSHGSRGSLDSVEGADIQSATLERIEQSPVEPSIGITPPTASSTSPSAQNLQRPVPVRSSSARELVETRLAGPGGGTSASLVAGPGAALARRPTLTRVDGTSAPALSKDGSAAQGAAPSRDSTAQRLRHQSSSALIEIASSAPDSPWSTTSEGRTKSHRRERSGKSSGSRSAGEEDPPRFFAARDHIPRYSTERDPRSARNGSISRLPEGPAR